MTLEEKLKDEEIYQVADDEKQQDWDRLEYQDIYKQAFIDGAKWARTKLLAIIQQEIADALEQAITDACKKQKDAEQLLKDIKAWLPKLSATLEEILNAPMPEGDSICHYCGGLGYRAIPNHYTDEPEQIQCEFCKGETK